MSDAFVHGYALLVGVGGDLPMTVDDAQGLANLLHDPTRCAYPADQIQLLTGEHACRDDVLATLDWLAAKAQGDPEAMVIVFFSGHGIEVEEYYYLLPFGWDLQNLPRTAIASAEFTEGLRAIQARKLLVLLDCCHAGGMADVKELPLVKSPVPPGLFDMLESGRGRVAIASSRKDELSYTGHPYSVFTGALLEALAGYGAFENDGCARVLDTMLWVARKVPERTQERQHPIVKVCNLESNFALAYYAGGSKEPRQLEWTAAVPAVALGLGAVQETTYQLMLHNYWENLLLIEERMSQYVEFTAIPLQLIRDKRVTIERISEIEQKLGLRPVGGT